MKYISKYSLVIVFFFVYFPKISAQVFPAVDTVGFIRIFYNQFPDSLFIDGNPVDVERGEMLKMPVGKVVIRGSLHCYHPVTQVVEIKKHQVKPVALKFKHFTTGKYNFYTYYFLSDLALIPGALALALKTDRRRNIFPPVLTAVSYQFFWHVLQGKQFDNCSREYHGGSHLNTAFHFAFYLTSFYNQWGNLNFMQKVTYIRRVPPPVNDFTVDVRREVKTTAIPKSFEQGYAYNVEIGKLLNRFIGFSVGMVYFPTMSLRVSVRELFVSGGDLLREYELSDTKSLYLFKFNTTLTPIRLLNQEIYLTFGRYWGNSLQLGKQFIFDPVTPVSATNQDTVQISYKISTSGYSAGIGIVSPVSAKIGLLFDFEIFSNMKFNIADREQTLILRSFRAGLRYYF